jgi:hypothetical protein
MVRWFAIALLVSACAQVGTITGGPADNCAPKVLSQSIENKACNVVATEQVLIFDEFIKLDQAQQRILLMPADSRLSFEVKSKQLCIKFEDPLKDNTTYTLTCNGGIKDITEGNDSLMTWTFSTGAVLDSLTLRARAKFCIPEKQSKKILLGLYTSDTTLTPRYLGSFDQKGFIQISGIREGEYWIKAFVDDNQNGTFSPTTAQDQFFEPTQIASLQNDTLLFELSTPKIDKQFTNPDSTSSKKPSDSLSNQNNLSSLVIELDTILDGSILELFQGDQLIESQVVQLNSMHFDRLAAGNYTLRCVLDLNQNLQWDAIDLNSKKRAEPLYYYPEVIKIRPNWELTIDVNISDTHLFNK